MEYPIKTACVVGLGYIGLPTAATLASRGVAVVGVDINPRVVAAVNAGHTYFSEPDLDMLLRAATTLGKLRATGRPEAADAFIIAVPTPFNDDRSPRALIRYVFAVLVRPKKVRTRQKPEHRIKTAIVRHRLYGSVGAGGVHHGCRRFPAILKDVHIAVQSAAVCKRR